MKNKHLLFLLLTAVIAPLAMKAQITSTLTVYGGSVNDSTTNDEVPIYGSFANYGTKCEFIIPAEKLSEMNRGWVSAMKFYLYKSYGDISATFDVFVKEVDATTLSGFFGTYNATYVYIGTISIASSQPNIEIDIPFSSSYNYGGGNLLIGIYQKSLSADFGTTQWIGERQSEYTAWQTYFSSNGSQTSEGQKFLPKITFTYDKHTTPTVVFPSRQQ